MNITPVIVLGVLFCIAYVANFAAISIPAAKPARAPITIAALVLWFAFFAAVMQAAVSSTSITQLPTL